MSIRHILIYLIYFFLMYFFHNFCHIDAFEDMAFLILLYIHINGIFYILELRTCSISLNCTPVQ